MKKRVIIAFICGFCILFCLNSILAANISLSYPAEVGFGGVFSLNFSLLDFNGLFDIKVDIFNSSDTLCSILAGASWQSCYNYLNDYINTSLKNSSTISLNITKNYVGVANLSVKVRNSVTSSTSTFSGFLINITSNNQTNTTTQTNQTNNQTTNTNTKTNTNNSKIYLEMDWDDEDILNNEEFEIKVSAFNLENYDYDLKLWIENLNEEGDIISERYDESNNEWKSGYYYIENFFSDSGNRTENILVRLNLDNSDFKGKARIYIKLRKSSTTIFEEDKTIEILDEPVLGEEKIIAQTEYSSINNEPNTTIRLNKPATEKTQTKNSSLVR